MNQTHVRFPNLPAERSLSFAYDQSRIYSVGTFYLKTTPRVLIGNVIVCVSLDSLLNDVCKDVIRIQGNVTEIESIAKCYFDRRCRLLRSLCTASEIIL